MNIDKNNYEAFFLDYHEGNLSPEQVAELLLFVEQHPELKEEFESFENITLYDLSTITFEDKEDLKKEITGENIEEYLIRSVEGTLNPAEDKLLADFIQQHPRYAAELELFRKTILPAEHFVYENKTELKRAAVITSIDELLISAVEGVVSPEESKLLKKQLSVDAELQNEYALYQRTKLVADMSIVYENREELKRRDKVVPVFWYVSGVAAAILLLIGLFFVFRTGQPVEENNFAKVENNGAVTIPDNVVTPEENAVAVNDAVKNQDVRAKSQDKDQLPVNNRPLPIEEPKNEQPVDLANNHAPENGPTNNKQPITSNIPEESPVVADNQQPKTNNEQPVIAFNDSRPAKENSANDYLTLREFAAKKIKETTLDENSVAAQKENGRLKRFSGWDVVQILSRGVSKLTGRDLEVKPKYNEEGDVTAYALGNAFEISRGK